MDNSVDGCVLASYSVFKHVLPTPIYELINKYAECKHLYAAIPSIDEYDCIFYSVDVQYPNTRILEINTSIQSIQSSIRILSICSDVILPELPNTITTITIYSMHCRLRPILPKQLKILNVCTTGLEGIEELPSKLVRLNCRCSYSNTTYLPILPLTLKYLNCGHCHIYTLPTLPQSLLELECDCNFITTLPTLPPLLTYLRCDDNGLTTIPTLPSLLEKLDVSKNFSLSSLPTLPDSITFIRVNNTRIKALPNVPKNLNTFCRSMGQEVAYQS